jgi:protein SCO1
MTPQVQHQPFLSPWWFLYAILVLGFPIFFMVNTMEPPDNYGKIKPFTLTNQLNQDVNSSTIKIPVVVNFIFTRCQNVCPTLSTKMSTLQQKIDPQDAKFISITVDPKYDTPSVLHTYAERFKADPERWSFLTGEEDNVRQIIRTFQQTYEIVQSQEESPNILHSEKFILLDHESNIRGFFSGDPEGLNLLMRSISAL